MKIAVASGKGGTGKTTFATALACAVEGPVGLLDCDVEAPNAAFFIRPDLEQEDAVTRLFPVVDEDQCTRCGECSRVCRFHAIVPLGRKVMVFNDLCHSCGGCTRICPSGAIREMPEKIGTLSVGRRGDLIFAAGRLDIGQAMSPPLIRAVLSRAPAEGLTIVDCPPGTSCPFVTAVRTCDAVVLVTEPTPFGLHDLQLAVETLQELGRPFAVVANRVIEEDNRISAYCSERNIPLLLQIPEDRQVARAYSRGGLLTDVHPELRSRLAGLPNELEALS